MESKKIKLITQIIFYGAIWGLLEATIGYFLHFVPAMIAGTIMFPIASVILLKAYNKTNSKAALLFIGGVAAAIKSIDLFLPSFSIYKTINPMMSIVLESLLVFAVVMLFTSEKVTNKLAAAQIASIGWRVGYVFYMLIILATTGFAADPLLSVINLVQFTLISGVIGGILASSLIFVDEAVGNKLVFKIDMKPTLAVGLLLIAAIVTFTL